MFRRHAERPQVADTVFEATLSLDQRIGHSGEKLESLHASRSYWGVANAMTEAQFSIS